MSIQYTDENVLKGLDSEMICLKNRIESFKNWPIKSGNCTKEKMAGQGFYFCNIPEERDGVRCFFCLQYLRDWEIDDDPQQEHLQFSPDCLFAKLNKNLDELTLKELSSLILQRDVIRMEKIFENELNVYDEKIAKLKEAIENL